MNAPVPAKPDASDLPAVIERARKLLDDGDLIAAKTLAALAYEEGSRATRLAERIGASEKLVTKARQLQGDALLIETRAKIGLADHVDWAQSEGVVAKRGRPKNVDKEDILTVEDLGLTRDELMFARKLRDAERKQPGIAAQAIAVRVNAGLNPTKANLRAAIGTASASNEERGKNFYQTPVQATKTLLAIEAFSPVIWEPACGKGAISAELEAAGHDVILSDIEDRGCADQHGECQQVKDFLETDRKWLAEAAFWGADKGEGPNLGADILTNPPYGDILNAFIAHALREHKPRKMALLLNINVLAGFEDEDRNWFWDYVSPARVHVFTRRLPMMHREGWDGKIASSRMNTAWFVWERIEPGTEDPASWDPQILLRLFKGRVDPDAAPAMLEQFPYGRRTEINRVDWKDYV
ncbi:MAG: SAM-dependent methyltransferase [Nitratireductor sp.]|nr:SAM-dependent methyltransferase [Nitratireductor sp.]